MWSYQAIEFLYQVLNDNTGKKGVVSKNMQTQNSFHVKWTPLSSSRINFKIRRDFAKFMHGDVEGKNYK